MNCLTKLFQKILILCFANNRANSEEGIVLIERNNTLQNLLRERSVIIECTLLDNTLNDVDHSALVSVLDSFIHDDE